MLPCCSRRCCHPSECCRLVRTVPGSGSPTATWTSGLVLRDEPAEGVTSPVLAVTGQHDVLAPRTVGSLRPVPSFERFKTTDRPAASSTHHRVLCSGNAPTSFSALASGSHVCGLSGWEVKRSRCVA